MNLIREPGGVWTTEGSAYPSDRAERLVAMSLPVWRDLLLAGEFNDDFEVIPSRGEKREYERALRFSAGPSSGEGQLPGVEQLPPDAQLPGVEQLPPDVQLPHPEAEYRDPREIDFRERPPVPRPA
eukprot:8995420-Pyramimonas_sp.AAC.1